MLQLGLHQDEGACVIHLSSPAPAQKGYGGL